MHDVSAADLHVSHRKLDTVIADFREIAGVEDLPALFGVEVGLVEDHATLVARVDLVYELLVVAQGDYCRFARGEDVFV